ncbi:hypothetical protein BVY03_01455 [bacterium K02(2017)]|nr:hypothetical protein BVY03_01455 [bacterium K02(2017)]
MKNLILKYQLLLVCLLALGLYANTLNHDYVYDDHTLTTSNKLTQKGFNGIPELLKTSYWYGMDGINAGEYRPLSTISFAIEYEFFKHQSFYSHLINILLYALSSIILLLVLKQLYQQKHISKFFPLIVTILFVAHPIHTEVVANVKSRDELLSFLNILLSILFLFKSIAPSCPVINAPQTTENKFKKPHLILSLCFFSLALFSKESSLPFILIIPLLLYYFSSIDLKKNMTLSALYTALALGYLFIRNLVLDTNIRPGGIVNNSLVGAENYIERLATAIFIIGKYLVLLVYPHPLVSDYSYNQIPLVTFSNIHVFLTFIICLSALIYALSNFKSKNLNAFWILYGVIAFSITSNLVILIGSTMGERFLYASSLAYCVLLTTLIFKVYRHFKLSDLFFKTSLIIILLLFSCKTITRNLDWKNNITLFTTDLKNSPNSSSLHGYYGTILMNSIPTQKSPIEKQKKIDLALSEFKKAVSIYPKHVQAWHYMGRVYTFKNDYKNAIESFLKSISLTKIFPEAYFDLGNAYTQTGALDQAVTAFNKSLEQRPNNFEAYSNLGVVYAKQKKFTLAIVQFEKALKLDPQNKLILSFLKAARSKL